MTDSVRVQMDQIDDSTGQAISHVVAEWYGMDRNIANALSMTLVGAVVGGVGELTNAKLEATGSDEIKAMIGKGKPDVPPGVIR